jgi:hypothetical protein
MATLVAQLAFPSFAKTGFDGGASPIVIEPFANGAASRFIGPEL